MDPNYHLYLAYSQNEYDIVNDSYYPIGQELLDTIKGDKRVSDSLIFDMNRRTIYAKGKEFGGLNPVFQKVSTGYYVENNDVNLARVSAYFVTGVSQDQYGRVSYSYGNAYVPLNFRSGYLDNLHGGAYMTSMYVNHDGEITYRYAEVNHTTTFGKLSASIYNFNNNYTVEVVVDDPYETEIGRNIGVINDSAGIVSIYDLADGTKIEDDIYGGERIRDLKVSNNDSIIAVHDDNTTVTYINYEGSIDEKILVEDRGPILTTHVSNDIVLTRYRDYTIDVHRRDEGDYNEIGQVLSDSTWSNICSTPNAIYYAETSAVNMTTRTAVNRINVFDSRLGDKSRVFMHDNVKGWAIKNINNELSYNTNGTQYVNNECFAYYYEPTRLALSGSLFVKSDKVTAKTFSTAPHGRINKMTFDCRYVAFLSNTTLRIYDSSAKIVRDGQKPIDPISLYDGCITMSNVSDFIVNNNSLFCILDTSGNVSLYDYGENNEPHLIRGNVISNVSKLVSFEYDSGRSYIKAVHNVSTAIIDYIYLDKQGNLTYHQHDASNISGDYNRNTTITHSNTIDVVTGIYQEPNGQVTYTFDILNTTHSTIPRDITTPDWHKPVSYVYLDEDGNLSYNVLDLTTRSGIYSQVSYAKGVKVANSINPASYTMFISSVSQDMSGKLSYTYSAIYTDPRDYPYHTVKLTQVTKKTNNDDYGYALIGISSTNDNKNTTSHTISYQVKAFATTNYVDRLVTTLGTDLIKVNDVLRYCGTVEASTEPNGSVTLIHTSDYGPGHGSIPDTDKGAVYKVHNTGYFGGNRVSPGDMVISNSDNATVTAFNLWDVINENLDLRTLPPDMMRSDHVLTYVNLTNDGTLSYSFDVFKASYKQVFKNEGELYADENEADIINILNGDKTGIKVITDVSIVQDNLDVHAEFSYSYIFANLHHHSSEPVERTVQTVISSVYLSNDGKLSYTNEDLTYAGPTSSGSYLSSDYTIDVITDITQTGYGKIYPTMKTIRVTDEHSRFYTTSDVAYFSGPKKEFAWAQAGNVSYSYVVTSVYSKQGTLWLSNLEASGKMHSSSAEVDNMLEAGSTMTGSLSAETATIYSDTVGSINVIGDTVLGSESFNSITINAANTTLPENSSIDFTNLQALWGVVGAADISASIGFGTLMCVDNSKSSPSVFFIPLETYKNQTVIGICIVPEDVMPDKCARFVSINNVTVSPWGNNVNTPLINRNKTYSNQIRPQFHIAADYLNGPVASGAWRWDSNSNRDNFPDVLYNNSKNELSRTVLENISDFTAIISDLDGKINTKLLAGHEIASTLQNYAPGGIDGWYVPSIMELAILFTNAAAINHVISGIDMATTLDTGIKTIFWGSTEYDKENAFIFVPNTGLVTTKSKDTAATVRAFYKVKQ